MNEKQVEQSTDGQNGSIPQNPGGNNTAFALDNPMQSGYTPPEREFMTAHTDNMARLAAEGVYTEHDRWVWVHGEATRQQLFGRINVMDLIKLKSALSIGVGGRGRDDAVRVAIGGGGGMMARARGIMSKLFGSGAGAIEPPTQPDGAGGR